MDKMSWNHDFTDFQTVPKLNLNMQANQKTRQPTNTPSSSSSEIKIQDITSGHSYINFVGLIICKDGPKSIINKKGTERHLLSFTVRDSEQDFINLTLWGSDTFISNYNRSTQVGDVVQISNAQVQTKQNNGMDDKYKPWTPSGFQLNVSENHGSIEVYNGWDVDHLRSLQHIPNKANNDYYTLDDINVNGMSLQGEHVNLLVAVKKLGKVRNITTKTGKTTKKCEVILFDETCANLPLDLWNNNVDIAQLWIPHQTVIFAADVKIIYNEFKSSMIAVSDSKTIFTIDPDTQEAYSLHSFATSEKSFTEDTSFNEGNVSFSREPDPDLDSIRDIYTVEEIKKKAQDENDKQTDYGVAFVFVSLLDIDNEDKIITKRICEKCKRVLKKESNYICLNTVCNGEDDNNMINDNYNLEYNITLSISDHTATLDFTHLQPTVAEHMLGFPADQINHVSLDQLTQIKWKYLLERCKIKFKLIKYNKDSISKYTVRILSLDLADTENVLNYFATQ
ncbi:hypothetical protein LOTGIDRAFT_204952 [Lottia gigantea]|uniref:Uncharacterized protein n=1 Tax=Lottia gigantea TaxID=225164 RepID=V4B330_LOTGI|nr:hypothetical protein LOTGIDRAFT_204952 [Lottia gigantea]ESP04648.1 hypothetical protein LOTGIDRAFT_204952 [Lottia gigantea]